MSQQKPPFLSSSGGGQTKSDPFPNRPQKSGGDGGGEGGGPPKEFPNRPQKSGSTESAGLDGKTIPGGGKLPFTGPSVETPKPYKLKG